jgi:hypothetical protein
MRTLTTTEINGVSGGVGPGGAAAGGIIAGTEYIFANAGTSNWNTGSFLLQVGVGAAWGFAGGNAMQYLWGFNAAVCTGTLTRIIEFQYKKH